MEYLIDVNDLQPGERLSVVVDDTPALVIRIQDQFFVVEDVCSHDGQPLSDGRIAAEPSGDPSIACPRHAARFDLQTGRALCMPATEPIRVFRSEVRDGAVWAGPSESTAARH